MEEKLKNIKCIILDVDGVLTDGSLICTPDGEIWRNMNAKDGYAIQAILKAGLKLAILTSGSGLGVLEKLQQFGVNLIFNNAHNKENVLKQFVEDSNLEYNQLLYVGDDIPDYGVMKMCGLSCCPNDAVDEIKVISDYISPINGGQGAVRDITELVLKTQGKWFKPS